MQSSSGGYGSSHKTKKYEGFGNSSTDNSDNLMSQVKIIRNKCVNLEIKILFSNNTNFYLQKPILNE